MVEHARGMILGSLDGLYELALGGTAVGTGLNSPKGFGEAAAEEAANALFGGGASMENVPCVEIEPRAEEIDLLELIAEVGLVESKSEGRRLIQQGGLKLDGQKANGTERFELGHQPFDILLQKGKKVFLRVVKK